MKPTSPIDGNVALLSVETGSALHRAASADATELEQTIKDRTVVTDVVLRLLSLVGLHVVGRNPSEELDILVGMELGHLVDNCRLRSLQGVGSISG